MNRDDAVVAHVGHLGSALQVSLTRLTSSELSRELREGKVHSEQALVRAPSSPRPSSDPGTCCGCGSLCARGMCVAEGPHQPAAQASLAAKRRCKECVDCRYDTPPCRHTPQWNVRAKAGAAPPTMKCCCCCCAPRWLRRGPCPVALKSARRTGLRQQTPGGRHETTRATRRWGVRPAAAATAEQGGAVRAAATAR